MRMRSGLRMGSRQQLRRTAVEITLFIILSLFLSLLYNAVSPSGLRILPKKSPQETQVVIAGSMLLSQSLVEQP